MSIASRKYVSTLSDSELAELRTTYCLLAEQSRGTDSALYSDDLTSIRVCEREQIERAESRARAALRGTTPEEITRRTHAWLASDYATYAEWEASQPGLEPIR
jgi:hypothetical protein